MNKLIIFVQVLTVVAALLCCTIQMGAQAKLFDKFFEDNRVSKCPAPGEEYEYEGPVTLRVLNTPKERCQEHCESKNLVSIRNAEQQAFGPKLICCCKQASEHSVPVY